MNIKKALNTVLIISPVILFSANPNWSVNPNNFEQNASATGIILLNLEDAGSGNSLGAFVNDECRGVASPSYELGQWMYYLTIYSNTSMLTVRSPFPAVLHRMGSSSCVVR